MAYSNQRKPPEAGGLMQNAYAASLRKRGWLESQLIGCGLCGLWPQVSQYLEPWMLSRADSKALHAAFEALSERGIPIDLVSAYAYLSSREGLAKGAIASGGIPAGQMLARRQDAVRSPENWLHHFFLLYEAVLASELLGILAKDRAWPALPADEYRRDCEAIASSLLQCIEGGDPDADMMTVWETAMQYLLEDQRALTHYAGMEWALEALMERHGACVRKFQALLPRPKPATALDMAVEARRRENMRMLQNIRHKATTTADKQWDSKKN